MTRYVQSLNDSTRKAFLIYSPKSDMTEGFRRGAESSISNIKTFLQSPIGGAWKEEEIQLIMDPGSLRIESLRKENPTFSLIYFFGHGDYNQDRNQTILRSCDILIPDQVLKTNSQKQLILIEACRGLSTPSLADDFNLAEDVNNTAFLSLEESREKHKRAIYRTADGIYRLYSSKKGNLSYYSESGGHFSRKLLQKAITWAQPTMGKYEEFLTAEKAYLLTAEEMIKDTIEYNQAPDYFSDSSQLANGQPAPFAIHQ